MTEASRELPSRRTGASRVGIALRRARVRSGLLAAFVLILPACQLSRGTTPRVCMDLANAFYLIALHKNRGLSEEAQIEMAVRAARDPDSDPTLRHWLHVIDLVYRFPEAGAHEIGWTVLDNCVVDGRGRAVVRTLWPRRR